MIGLSSLCAAVEKPATNTYAVLGDARQNTFFVAEVEHGRLLGPPELHPSGTAVGKALSLDRPVLTFDRLSSVQDDRVSLTYPSAKELAHCLAYLQPPELQRLAEAFTEPIYLRAPFVTVPKSRRRTP